MGTSDEHLVDEFWADRFLTHSSKSTEPTGGANSAASTSIVPEGTAFSAPLSTPPESHTGGAKFSLTGYSGAWVPVCAGIGAGIGAGMHQCPGKHWVKLQILLSFAMINDAFEIELLDAKDSLKVDMRKFGLGTLQPAEKARFRIRRKHGVVSVGSDGK